MRWMVRVEPWVVRGVFSLGFSRLRCLELLAGIQEALETSAEEFQADRWERSPERYFVCSIVFEENGYHRVNFIIDDRAAVTGVLVVVWVE
jgi:hypothetical protein